MSLLIIGGTGTLGRQIVLQALTKGYKVRCLVRNFRKASFLKEWGVELVYGDLTRPETLPPCLLGITAIIDASTSRPDEFDSLKNVDWYGKFYLIEAAKVANIKHFIFFSAQNIEQFENIPLMRLKYRIEQKLQQSEIPYTIFRLTGFYQGLIDQYAIPILENLPIWVTNENTSISYMDTQDIAKFCLRTLQIPKTMNQTFFLSGLKGWVSSEIVGLCEQLAGQTAKVQKVPLILLKLISNFFGFFEWGQNISDRLAFVEILNTENNFSKSTFYLYKTFKIESEELIQLDDYFLEYFVRLLKRLRDINFEDVQKQKNLII
ncbi:MAG: SDR family oxidoreductase [Oligoflexales bacterium]